MNTAWLYLFLAGVLEVGWAFGMKYTDGWTRLWPSLFTIALMCGSFTLLSLALREIPISVGYAVWVGIGAVGVALVGMVFLGESVSAGKIAALVAIIGGVIGLKLL